MRVAEIAEHLAIAAARFPFLGECSALRLEELVAAELGNAEALDDFCPYGRHYAKARGPATILHIISGNTPAAGLQSLLRGLLLKAHNLCKIPSAGLPELAEFCAALPPALAKRVEISSDLPASWMDRADAWIVFGSDETIAHFRGLSRPDQRFVAHGHRISFGVVLDDPDFASVVPAAQDVVAFDQQGCLSPQVIFVREGEALTAELYANRLADELEVFEEQQPRRTLSAAEAGEIRRFREAIRFRAANGEELQVWDSPGSTVWTVVSDRTRGFPSTPLNRFIFVKPLPSDFPKMLQPLRPHLSAAGIWPMSREFASFLSESGVKRVCPLGRMQRPPLTWQQDGMRGLAALVEWVDLELE